MTKMVYKVERFYPGVICCESDTVTVKSKDPKKYKNRMPKECDCFRFFDSFEEDFTPQKGKPFTHKVAENYSPMYFPDGEILTLAQVKKYYPDLTILISNMKSNRYKTVVKTRSGQFRPANDDYEVI